MGCSLELICIDFGGCLMYGGVQYFLVFVVCVLLFVELSYV